MKIRNGFVSNSSSTSFCVVGYSSKDMKLTMEEFINKIAGKEVDPYEFKNTYKEDGCGCVIDYECDCAMAGLVLFRGSLEDGIDGVSLPIQDAITSTAKLKEKLGTDHPIKIYMGTYAS